MHSSVSVVIPCYCCGKTIKRAIHSVVNQTQPPAEIIIVNDGSEDNSLLIVQQLQDTYGSDLIKIINLEENYGVSHSRNQGWDASISDYVAFLDADDTWKKNKLELQLKILQHYPDCDLLGALPPLFNPYNQTTDLDLFLEEERAIKYTYKLKIETIISHNILETSSILLRRNIPLQFSTELRYCEDHILWIAICLRQYHCYVTPFYLTNIYKNFGQGGLTQKLFQMRLGYLKGCWHLYKQEEINLLKFILIVFKSIIKYLALILIRPKNLSRLKSKYLLNNRLNL